MPLKSDEEMMEMALTALKWALYALAGFVAVLTVLFFLTRFLDGPIGMIPGGLLKAGEMRSAPANWSFVRPVDEVELQSDGHSRTTWIVAINGQAYIPASANAPPFKTWHKRALDAPEAVVRIDGIRYAVNLERIVQTDPIYMKVLERVIEKYQIATPDPKDVAILPWVFRLAKQ